MATDAASDYHAMKHDVIICTKNRRADLEFALDSLAAQTRPPNMLIVVDASDNDDTKVLVRHWSSAEKRSFGIEYVKAAPGLPAQRNLGVETSSADVVHFLDDDVVVDPDYIASIAAVFEHDTYGQIVGVGGLITNQPARHVRIWWRLALLDSKHSGVILRSGANIIVSSANEQMRVEWLSGCSMSFRSAIVRQLRFDEELPGYALMEDVDFGFRAAQIGELVLEPKARLVHNVSPVGRWGHPARQRASTYRRGWFVEKNLPRWCLVLFWWSVVAGAAVQCCVAVVKRKRWVLRAAIWRLQGGLDFIRGAR
jgi:GT2 family glycosyltransferase